MRMSMWHPSNAPKAQGRLGRLRKGGKSKVKGQVAENAHVEEDEDDEDEDEYV